ncbi:SAPS-domain-containing protein [Choiromyces venosus 120613-1]|uniref:SAPS-domain-containing protein n=1 Tax=Choiromyces venosus 120613-1 TaxID=1336337 RepID=A0A3N4JWD5_9PEZI|nr:SAPS-domain-containing protein [Choiromyces venosus 120613-1]
MFWRFGGYANISTLDSILEKPDVTLEDLLEESDLIQELKQQNGKLIEFLRREDVMWKLLEYVVAPKRSDPVSNEAGSNAAEVSSKNESEEDNPNGWNQLPDTERDKEEKIRLKYAYVCCEVLSSESWSMAETLMENLQPLQRPAPLDPLQAGYFTKVNETLLDRKTDEMMEFFKGLDNIVPKILKHVDCPMIMDLLLKIISMEKCEGGTGIVDWLHSQNLIPLLLSFLSSDYPATTQTSSGDFIKAIITISANASQNEQSCIGPNDLTRQLVSEACVQGLIRDMLNGGNPLTVGVGIVIEVIRKNNSDYDPDVGTGVDNAPSSRDPIYLGTLLRLFAKHVPDFMKLILTQCVVVTSEDGSKTEKRRELKAAFGETIEPLGFDRFKTCELMAELLHCSNMGLLNERGGERYVKERDRERDRLRAEREKERQDVERANDINGSIEGVVVEKAPLQVQNGGAEIDEDGLNEDEFEDVAVSGLLEEVRGATGQKAMGGLGKDVVPDEPKDTKMNEDEDAFVDEPLSPAALAVDAPPTSESGSLAPVPAPIPADSIPRLDGTPIPAPPSDVLGQSSAPSDLATEYPGVGSDSKDEKMEDAPLPPPPPPAKDDDKTPVPKDLKGSEEKTQQEGSSKAETVTEGDLMITDVPKAPSPPPADGDDDNGSLLKGGRSLVDDLKTTSIAAPLNPQGSSISQDRMDADLPPLPKEAFEKSKQPDDPEEDLLDLGGSPYSTATFRSTGNSSFEEYETMIEKDLEGNPVVGDYLKMMFVENSVVPTILDFFFRFPWNNFLHNVVYDVVQQVFNGPMERGYNRALAIDLFATGRITERIVEGQKASDKVEAEKKMRLGYMGHLTLIAEEVVKFAERHPPEILGHKVIEKVSDPLWIEYVEETLAATRERDNAILGGVRPDMSVGPRQAVLNAVQAQAFNGNFSDSGSLILGDSVSGDLETIDLANGSSGSAGIGSGAGISGSAGGLLSGFGSSSDEEDEDMERDDEDDDEVNRLGLSGSSDQVGDLTDLLFDNDLEDDFFEDMTFL